MRTGTKPVLMLELFGLGVWNISVSGWENLGRGKDEAPILVTNHVAVLDPVVTSRVFRLPAQITKVDNLEFPLMGTVIRGSQSLCVDRDSQSSRTETQRAIVTRSREPGWPPLLIYPEGVCSNGTALLEFKAGAFIPGLPVQPVAVRYPYKYFNPSWTNGTAVQVIGSVMAQFYNPVEVIILPVHKPSEEEKKTPKLFAENVRRKIAAGLGIPLTPCSLIDMQVCQLPAIRKKYKMHTNTAYLLGSGELLERCPEVTPDQLRQWALDFCTADADGDSRLDYEEFCKTEALVLTKTPELWKFLCQGEEKLKFRNFAYACAVQNS